MKRSVYRIGYEPWTEPTLVEPSLRADATMSDEAPNYPNQFLDPTRLDTALFEDELAEDETPQRSTLQTAITLGALSLGSLALTVAIGVSLIKPSQNPPPTTSQTQSPILDLSEDCNPSTPSADPRSQAKGLDAGGWGLDY